MKREIQEYINAIPEKKLEPFHYVRDRLLKIEGVEETFDYSMPTFAIGKRKIFALAAQKNHISLYVMYLKALDQVRSDLSHLNVGKSCVRFTKKEKFPKAVLNRLIEESLKLV